jgi:hypothetical protein
MVPTFTLYATWGAFFVLGVVSAIGVLTWWAVRADPVPDDVRVLRVKPDDLIVITAPPLATRDWIENSGDQMREIWPHNKTIVISHDTGLMVVSPEERTTSVVP